MQQGPCLENHQVPGKPTPEQVRALSIAHELCDKDGYLNMYKWAKKLGMLVVDDHNTETSKERPAVVKYDDTFDDEPAFSLYANKYADPEAKRQAMKTAIWQFVTDKSVIVEAGVFPPKPEQQPKR